MEKENIEKENIEPTDVQNDNSKSDKTTNPIISFFKDKWFYFVALLLPWIIGLGHSYIADTWVTGHGNIASGDLQAQIIPIAYEYWDKVHSGDSFAFTWNIADGVNFGSLLGYINSPFTRIMLLLPRHMIPDFMQFAMMAKWSLIAFSMVFFFYHTRYNTLKDNKRAVSLFLGLAYALGAGVMSFVTFVQFTDALVCFPFLLLLLEKMVFEKKWKLYFFVLLYTIGLNTYIGYQICLFLILWFIMLLFDTDQERIKKFFMFAGISVLAAATKLGGILGGLNLASGRLNENAASDNTYYVTGTLVKVHDFIEHLFMCEDIAPSSSYSPNIYITVTAAFLVLMFPMVKMKISKKIYMIIVLLLLTASFFSGYLSLVWHLFNIPNGVHHRFMYLFAFYMLFLLMHVLTNIEDVKISGTVIAGLVSIALFVYTFFNIKTFGPYLRYIGTFMIIVFMVIMLVLLKKKSILARNTVRVIVICGIAEALLSSFQAFSYFEEELYYGAGGYIEQECEMLKKANLAIGERIVSASPTPNIGLITGQNSDAVFMSSINTANKYLHEKLGMASNSSVEFVSRGASPLVNLIYNLRYGHGESEMLFSDAKLIDKSEYYGLYRMERLAGLGYMVNDSITEWNIENKNCFQVQNDFVKEAVGGENIFSPVNPDITCTDFVGISYDCNRELLESGIYEYTIDKPLKTEYDARSFEFKVEEDMDLYMYFYSPNYMNVYIFIDGDLKHGDLRSFKQSTYHIGNVKKDQTILVCTGVTPKTADSADSYKIDLMFGKFDENAYALSYEKLSGNIYNIEEETSEYIKGSIHADESGIMMTSVPADDNFNVFVDGEKKEYDVIGGALIGVPLDSGDHTVEFKYGGEGGSNIGSIVKYMAYIIYIMLFAISILKQRKNDKN